MSYNGFYLVGNYPDKNTFLQAAIEGLSYFDFIEVGLPFSDPVADGPVLSFASYKALKAGATTESVLSCVTKIKEHITRHNLQKKIYIMTYANKIIHNGIANNLQKVAESGAQGIIIADVPFVESQQFVQQAKNYNLEYIHFVTPESTESQIKAICANASGFIYTISLRGTTGGALVISDEIKKIIQVTKRHAIVPVVLGFGIQSAGDVEQALQISDGCIIGTALVKKLEEGIEAYRKFLKELSTVLI